MDGGTPLADTGARIGPNAILQLVTVLDQTLGRAMRDRVMRAAGQAVPPPDAGMWPEAACRAVHQVVYRDLPDQAEGLLTRAGTATADYILANRIPGPAKALIRLLPARLGARLLTSAITRHAWTFAGSGRFCVISHRPLVLEITYNPLGGPCHWHAAVFARLYQALVWPNAHVTATAAASVNRFAIAA